MAEMGFTLTSPAWRDGGIIPSGSTCDGPNISPHLEWTHVPDGTRSFALIMEDADAAEGTFTHWIVFDIDAARTTLAENQKHVGVSGRNDFQYEGYGGPCPPPNDGQHRYYFRLYALDVESLELPSGATREKVEQAMEGHILDSAELMGRFERRTGG